MPETRNKVRQFFNNYPLKNFKRGEVIINPTRRVKQIFYLVDGYVKQYQITKDGRIKSVNIFKQNSFFPMMLVLADFENKYFFEAISHISVRMAPANEVSDFVRQNSEVGMDLLRRFYIGVDGILNILQSIMYENSQKKLAAFILMLSERFGAKQASHVKINIPLTHQDLASFTGMIRETVSYEMKKLQKKGIIADNKKRKTIEILKFKELEKIIQ